MKANEATFNDVVQAIRSVAEPSAIILFGSYARGTWFVLLVLIFSGSSTPLVTKLAQNFSWWGREVEGWRFALGTSVLFASWAVFGAYRLMCQELQVRTTPWGWAAFVLFLAWYLSGPLVAIAALIAPFVLALHTPTTQHLLLAVCMSGAVTTALLQWAYARAGKLLE